jgi:hypothetical protein
VNFAEFKTMTISTELYILLSYSPEIFPEEYVAQMADAIKQYELEEAEAEATLVEALQNQQSEAQWLSY